MWSRGRVRARIIFWLITDFLTEVSLMGVVPTEDESKWRSNAKSFKVNSL